MTFVRRRPKRSPRAARRGGETTAPAPSLCDLPGTAVQIRSNSRLGPAPAPGHRHAVPVRTRAAVPRRTPPRIAFGAMPAIAQLVEVRTEVGLGAGEPSQASSRQGHRRAGDHRSASARTDEALATPPASRLRSSAWAYQQVREHGGRQIRNFTEKYWEQRNRRGYVIP